MKLACFFHPHRPNAEEVGVSFIHLLGESHQHMVHRNHEHKIEEYEKILDVKESRDNWQIGDTVRVQINKNTFEKSAN